MVAVGHADAEVREAQKRGVLRMRPRSLKFRLIAISLAWLVFSLLATGAVLVLLFRANMQRHFDQALQSHLEELVAAASGDADGSLNLSWEPADPRFRKPLSGWFWEVRNGVEVKRSPSLVDQSLEVSGSGPGASHIFDNIPGPGGVRLRIIAQDTVIPGTSRPLSVLVAGPCVTVQNDVLIFMGQLAAALLTLGLTLSALIAAQVIYGLRPLAMVRAGLMQVRLGRGSRLQVVGPSEIAPLIDELNGLLDERDMMVAQARSEAGNLAHALKTPIAVIRNEASTLPEKQGATLKAEADKMIRVVEHHLVNARAQMKQRSVPAGTSLDRVMEDVRFSLERLHPQRQLEFHIANGLAAACAEDDLGEMIGNLADNACKWAQRIVRISARCPDGRVLVQIDDDGPGLNEDQRAQVLMRGERLDKSVPGYGLGLSITAKLAAIHGGTLRLERSEIGGLAAILELPAAGSCLT